MKAREVLQVVTMLFGLWLLSSVFSTKQANGRMKPPSPANSRAKRTSARAELVEGIPTTVERQAAVGADFDRVRLANHTNPRRVAH